MRTLVTLLAIALLSSIAVADDVADTKKAFAILVEYEKTDNERAPELFAKDCAVTFIFSDGTNEKVIAVPTEVFIDAMKKEIAKKKGSTVAYEEVKYSQEASGIRVTANVHYLKSGRKGPLSVLYRRDDDGILRIHDYKVTVYGNQ